MRDSGWDQLPPDVRFCREACRNESPALDRSLSNQHLTEKPSCEVCWFRERVGSTGRRVRKIMVVALARKLLIALWRFVVDGVVPEGAVLKSAA